MQPRGERRRATNQRFRNSHPVPKLPHLLSSPRPFLFFRVSFFASFRVSCLRSVSGLPTFPISLPTSFHPIIFSYHVTFFLARKRVTRRVPSHRVVSYRILSYHVDRPTSRWRSFLPSSWFVVGVCPVTFDAGARIDLRPSVMPPIRRK